MKKRCDEKHPGAHFSMRRLIQVLFSIIVITLGLRFYGFVSQLEAGIIPAFDRPPGVEAFLPISALVSLKHLLFTGEINSIHPSALVIFLIILLTTLVVKRGFCSWVCPFGLVSDMLSKLNAFCFKQKATLPGPVDLLLRSTKYVLAGFFVWTIFFKMPAHSIEQFIQSPYNRFADIKMLYFFLNISSTALSVILVLIVLSFIVPYFWCRYLCPYGAVLGVSSFLSRGKIKRNPVHCTRCGTCEQNCPGRIRIRQKEGINSSECTACMTCVKNCPEKQAIGFFIPPRNVQLGQPAVALIFCMVFFMGIALAKVSGKWQNQITKPEYQGYVIQGILPRAPGKRLDPETMEKMMKVMKSIRLQREQQLQSSQQTGTIK